MNRLDSPDCIGESLAGNNPAALKSLLNEDESHPYFLCSIKQN
jgi:hypothetical protein